MPTCAIYTRVSTKDQSDKGFSLDAQEKTGRELCQRNKWQFRLFAERGKSADKENLDNRPALEEILDLAEDAKIQYLFVTELDRLSRSPVTLAYIKKILHDADVKVVTPSQTFDFRDDEDDFITDLLGILAKRENRLRVKRSKRAKDEAVQYGRWVGGILPYGWTKQPCEGDRLKHNKVVPHPEESKVVLKMIDWFLDGMKLHGVARKLNAMGVATKTSSDSNPIRWSPAGIYQVLKNPIHKGDYIFKGKVIKIPGIVESDRWGAVQAQLKENGASSKRSTRRMYLLRGLLVCGRCGSKFWGRIKPSTGEKHYYCGSRQPNPDFRFCGMKNLRMSLIEGYVWDITRNILIDSSVIKQALISQDMQASEDNKEIVGQITAIDREIGDIAQQTGRLLDLYARQSVSVEDLDAKAAELKSQKEELVKRRDSLIRGHESKNLNSDKTRKIQEYVSEVRERLGTLTDTERYELLHTVISRIIVNYDDKTKIHSIDIEFAVPIENTPSCLPPVGLEQSTLQLSNRRSFFWHGSLRV